MSYFTSKVGFVAVVAILISVLAAPATAASFTHVGQADPAICERQAVLAALHSPRFVDKSPAAVYAALLDEGGILRPFSYYLPLQTFQRNVKCENTEQS